MSRAYGVFCWGLRGFGLAAGSGRRPMRGDRAGVRPGRNLGYASASTKAVFAVAGVLAVCCAVVGRAQGRERGPAAVRASLVADLDRYLTEHRADEHISALSLTVTFRGARPSINLAVGRSRYRGGRRVSPYALWQIGSNTKAFTSVVLLQLEAAHKLSINDTLGRWLPQYPAWRRIRIKQLLNMTSGIQDFAAQPAFLRAYAAAPCRVFTAPRLVSYAVGLPRMSGYVYSNTNYLLAQMIIRRASHHSFGDQVRKRITAPLGLNNTFISARYPRAVTDRLPDGYFFFPPELLPQMASQFRKNQARYPPFGLGSGGFVSSLPDVAKWDRALYTGRELPRRQQRELESLVSTTTGKPISHTTRRDPVGFGLGVGQLTTPPFRRVSWYEGQTFAFRVLHVYLPRSGTDIVIGLNSSVPESKSVTLAAAIYKTLHKAGLS